MERKLNDKNYIAIADWMVSDFDFNTKELLCYAIIYGFSQDGENVFSGSLEYLAQWLGVRRDNVLRYLNSLLEKGVITKEKKSSAAKSWCEYKVLIDKGAVRNSDHIIISPWMVEDLGLKDKELILYSLIYGFSKTGSNSYFSGNNSYMSKWLGIDRSNVKRYTSSLLKKGLINRIEENNTFKYTANRPNYSGGGQFEYTLVNSEENENTYGQNEYRGSQFEYTPSQIEEFGMVNLSTNNLSLNNLDNNLNNINNNIVGVINSEIFASTSLSEEENRIFLCKIKDDIEIVKSIRKTDLDYVKVMKSYALDYFRYQLVNYMFLDEKDIDTTNDPCRKAQILILNTLTLKRYEKKIDEINNLEKNIFVNLFNEAYRIYNPDDNDDLYIRKSPEAYFIGIIDNTLKN